MEDAGKVFSSHHMTSTGRLAASLGSVAWDKVTKEESPSIAAQLEALEAPEIPSSSRHPGHDLRWFSNPFHVLQGVEQVKRNRTMVWEIKMSNLWAIGVMMKGSGPAKSCRRTYRWWIIIYV
jgi:hypothetical protein